MAVIGSLILILFLQYNGRHTKERLCKAVNCTCCFCCSIFFSLVCLCKSTCIEEWYHSCKYMVLLWMFWNVLYNIKIIIHICNDTDMNKHTVCTYRYALVYLHVHKHLHIYYIVQINMPPLPPTQSIMSLLITRKDSLIRVISLAVCSKVYCRLHPLHSLLPGHINRLD